MKGDKQYAEAAARRIIERFGESALREIDQRIVELDDQGEFQARDLWKEIREFAAKRLGPLNGGD